MEEIIQYINENYTQDLQLQELAEQWHFSNAYLSRYLKNRLGMSFISYLKHLRLHYATEELLYTDKSIIQIAMDNGFTTVMTFNKLFKQEYHITPNEYRKKMKADFSGTAESKDHMNKEIEEQRRLKEQFGMEFPDIFSERLACLCVIADSESAEPYISSWSGVVSVGPAKMLLNSSIQNEIIGIKSVLNLKYIHIRNIFSDEMLIVDVDNARHPNFNRLDGILDFLVDNGLRPYIEFCEKPEFIIRTSSKKIRVKEKYSIFRTLSVFLEVIDSLFHHLVYRYGTEQIENWIFELWDNVDKEAFENWEPYERVYRGVRNIIDCYVPQAKLGGRGTNLGWSNEYTQETLHYWKEHDIRPDFFSFVYYPYFTTTVEGKSILTHKTDDNDLVHTLEELHMLLKKEGLLFVKKLYRCSR